MHPLSESAERLRALHHTGDLLVLPNAWDAASARLFEQLGAPAVATTSAGVAESIGYADHEATPPEAMFAAVARIACTVDVPVTADVEAGYRLSSETLVEELLEAGAVGLNVEDSVHNVDGETMAEPAHHADRIVAIKEAARANGIDIFVNARVDSLLHGTGLDDALERARAYVAAGADCVYPIGAATEEEIAALVEGVSVPVNVLARPDAPPRARLAELGVTRVTFGPLLFRGALAEAGRVFQAY